MNDCQIKLFMMTSFQLRFVVTETVLLLVLIQCSLLLRFREKRQAAISCELFSVV